MPRGRGCRDRGSLYRQRPDRLRLYGSRKAPWPPNRRRCYQVANCLGSSLGVPTLLCRNPCVCRRLCQPPTDLTNLRILPRKRPPESSRAGSPQGSSTRESLLGSRREGGAQASPRASPVATSNRGGVSHELLTSCAARSGIHWHHGSFLRPPQLASVSRLGTLWHGNDQLRSPVGCEWGWKAARVGTQTALL